MFHGGWNYSRGNPCGGFANFLQLFPETLLPVRQSFTCRQIQVFKFLFNEKVSPTHQNLLYQYYKNAPMPPFFWRKPPNVGNSEKQEEISVIFTVRWLTVPVSGTDPSLSTSLTSVITLQIWSFGKNGRLISCHLFAFLCPLSTSSLLLKVCTVHSFGSGGKEISSASMTVNPPLCCDFFFYWNNWSILDPDLSQFKWTRPRKS